jgi:hypothetical protein
MANIQQNLSNRQTDGMTKSERDGLAQLCRRRERVAKTAVVSRAAELRADFEVQLDATYAYDTDEVWSQAHAAAQAATAEAKKVIRRRCQELGIPAAFAPSINTSWYDKGENATAKRRVELRRIASTRIDAMVKEAHHAIEAASVEVQTTLLAGGLQSAEAKNFLESMPTPAQLMPRLELSKIEATRPLAQMEAEAEIDAP